MAGFDKTRGTGIKPLIRPERTLDQNIELQAATKSLGSQLRRRAETVGDKSIYGGIIRGIEEDRVRNRLVTIDGKEVMKEEFKPKRGAATRNLPFPKDSRGRFQVPEGYTPPDDFVGRVYDGVKEIDYFGDAPRKRKL